MLNRSRVLAYVEDRSADAMLLDEALRMAHVNNPVQHYRTGEELLAALNNPQHEQPDILLIDMSLPGGVDGLAVVKKIREEHPGMSDTPIIIVTGDDTKNARKRAGDAGAEVFVTKPLTMVNLIQALRLIDDQYWLEIVKRERTW